MRVTIVGAGIAGLAAAISLHEAGFGDVTVFEADSRPDATGFGLNILPNAVRELAELGLLGEVERHAVRTRELAMYNRHGQLVWREDRGRSAGYDWPQIAIARCRLVEVLAAEVRRRFGEGAIVHDARLVDLDQASGGVRATLIDRYGRRRAVESDVLVGADGIHSTVRTAFYPSEGPPPCNGVTMYRGTTWGEPFLTGATMAVLGDDRRRLVLYPIDRDGDRVLINWVAAFPREDDAVLATEEPRETILRHLGRWSPPEVDLAGLLGATHHIRHYPMIDREPIPRWSFGAATLAGDAAHAMYPAGSNGATQAIVDARVLAHHLATTADTQEALQAYEAERRPQMTDLQRSNRAMGPERVITLAHQRAPHGFDDVAEVFSPQELAEISDAYAVTGRFDREWVNTRPSLTVSRPISRSTP
ncbi:FAD-dependent oxidoreductase [Nonomuraea sp. NPDC050663]|uniref:FAD-dependent oxidoreductase n=1 Tax=Nonomuraea sp. NPDC050663 TaxID=3364370 RepID=UPI0037B6BB29